MSVKITLMSGSDMVFGQPRVHDPAVALVELSFHHRRHAQPHDDAITEMAARGSMQWTVRTLEKFVVHRNTVTRIR